MRFISATNTRLSDYNKHNKNVLYKLLCFYYDSDAFISKGMITILVDIYGENTPSDILTSDFELLKKLQLDILLTPGRRNGVYSMLQKIKKYASSFQ